MATVDEERVRRIETLVRRLETVADAESREIGEQLMQAVLDLQGAALEKMMDLAFESKTGGEALIRQFAGDTLISSLLILHGLHPDDLETRVTQALAKSPGHLELVSVLDGVVRVRGNGIDEAAVQTMLRDAVPDATEIIVQTPAHGFVPLFSIGGVVSRAS